MIGRESKESNNIFYVCSLIEKIARQTKNHRSVVVNALGKVKLQQIYELADIFHSQNIDQLSDELISKANISTGYFDSIAIINISIPTIWDIGKVFKRLILDIASHRNSTDYTGILIEVYNSWISRKIEDFNSSMYYENSDFLLHSYLTGDVLE